MRGYLKKFQSIYQCAVSKKKKNVVSSLSIWGNDPTLQTALGNFLILCQMGLLPNINFLPSKQNKETKNWSKYFEAVGWYCYY